MKTRMLMLATAFLLSSTIGFGQQAEKTLVKAFNVTGHNSVFMDVDGNVEVQTWNEPTLRVMMKVTLLNGTETVLKSLMTAGRYNLDFKLENGRYSIVAPGLDRQVKLSAGQDLGEQVTYTVYAPQNLLVKTRTDEATGITTPKPGAF